MHLKLRKDSSSYTLTKMTTAEKKQAQKSHWAAEWALITITLTVPVVIV